MVDQRLDTVPQFHGGQRERDFRRGAKKAPDTTGIDPRSLPTGRFLLEQQYAGLA
jgi:hypothetical protein